MEDFKQVGSDAEFKLRNFESDVFRLIRSQMSKCSLARLNKTCNHTFTSSTPQINIVILLKHAKYKQLIVIKLFLLDSITEKLSRPSTGMETAEKSQTIKHRKNKLIYSHVW